MNNHRRTGAWNKRQEANQLANQREHPDHISNDDEQKFRHKEETAKCHDEAHYLEIKDKPSYLMSFTKGLPHNFDTGLIQDPDHFQFFVRGIDSGDFRDFRDTPLGNEENAGSVDACKPPDGGWKSEKARDNNVKVRGWESQSAGLAYELEGPDAQAVTMPPAPALGSDELTAEMGEIYVQALLRDCPFYTLTPCLEKIDKKNLKPDRKHVRLVNKLVGKLNDLKWFKENRADLDPPVRQRHRSDLTAGNAFRGITRGDDIGPYLSQFLLIGNTGINGNDNEREIADGLITYGALTADQRVRVASKGKDYMTCWEEWFDAQNGADLRELEAYDQVQKRRFIFTPRDLATYVHYDALYEAYLNACLLLLGRKMPFDPGIPFQEADNRDHQQGFAHFGGPHILSLVTEVATRALKAVRFQKYNVHRRCRPEVLAARLSKARGHAPGELGLKSMAPELEDMIDQLGEGPNDILGQIEKHNAEQNEGKACMELKTNYLLPMAFCEGSPMHPAYGAGHATVAGACVTILKAFFDCKHVFKANGEDSDRAYISINDGKELLEIDVRDQNCQPAHLTVEGELNKLASNISIGRNWAGVHYFTDYWESILMGEEIALGILEEQKLMFGEHFSMTVPLFGGGARRI